MVQECAVYIMYLIKCQNSFYSVNMTACIFLYYVLQMTDGSSMCSLLACNPNA